jgi:hypothetical protein
MPFPFPIDLLAMDHSPFGIAQEYEEHLWYFVKRLLPGITIQPPGYTSARSLGSILKAAGKFMLNVETWDEIIEGRYALVGSPETVADTLIDSLGRLGTGDLNAAKTVAAVFYVALHVAGLGTALVDKCGSVANEVHILEVQLRITTLRRRDRIGVLEIIKAESADSK